MEYEIKTFDEQYLEAQVELGKKNIDHWKFQSQSSLEHLKRVYDRDDFNPNTRLYALLDGKLVGFQTSQILEEDELIGRLEFPIVDPKHPNVLSLLQEHLEEYLKQQGVKKLRVRVSPHWGETEKYAEDFSFKYEKPHLMTSKVQVKELQTVLKSTYSSIHIDPNNDNHKKLFAQIFPKRFPMRYEEEVYEWFSYYADQNRITWIILMDNDNPVGHLIGFERDASCAITAFFSIGDHPELKLKELLSYAIYDLKSAVVDQLSLSIGDAQIKYAKTLNDLGLNLEEQISYFTKHI